MSDVWGTYLEVLVLERVGFELEVEVGGAELSTRNKVGAAVTETVELVTLLVLNKLKLDEIDEALDDSELDCDIDELVEAEDVAEEDIVDVNEIESMVALLVEAIEVDDAILEVSIVADTEPDAGLLEVENEAELEEVWLTELDEEVAMLAQSGGFR